MSVRHRGKSITLKKKEKCSSNQIKKKKDIYNWIHCDFTKLRIRDMYKQVISSEEKEQKEIQKALEEKKKKKRASKTA